MTSFKNFVALFLATLLLAISVGAITSQSGQDDDLSKKKQEIEDIENELNRLQGEKQTLSTTIQYLDGKIRLTRAQISETQNELEVVEDEIKELGGKIAVLDISLVDLTNQLVHRINQIYKRSRTNFLLALIASDDLDDLLSRYKYLQLSQRHNRKLIYELETARTNFDQQKDLKEQKQEELDDLSNKLKGQQTSLASQQEGKKQLLAVTKNDEKRFQGELAKKLAELEAIQSIIAGKGDETQIGGISQNQNIAKIIPSSSACSSGAHLHFEVAQNGAHKNPADFLSGKSVTWDNGPDGQFSFGGSWSWPIDDQVRITQGYGMTFFASTLRYYGGSPHTGIDMTNSSNYSVKAVQNGILFRGAIACGGGTLRYVKVDHNDSDIDTYYLHVNY